MEPAKIATKNLEIKLRQLRLTVSKTNHILDSPNREAIERHLKAMQTIINEAAGLGFGVNSPKQSTNVQ